MKNFALEKLYFFAGGMLKSHHSSTNLNSVQKIRAKRQGNVIVFVDLFLKQHYPNNGTSLVWETFKFRITRNLQIQQPKSLGHI